MFRIATLVRAGAVALPLAIAGTWAVAQDQTVVEVAAGNDNFETLVAAIEAAGLAETLSGEGTFTVFAPTDEAFEALPEGTVDNLLMPENRDRLVSVLTYHVVPGRVMSSDLQGQQLSSETV